MKPIDICLSCSVSASANNPLSFITTPLCDACKVKQEDEE